MRRTSSEIIRHLENRVAYLERQASKKSVDQQLQELEQQKNVLNQLRNSIKTLTQIKSDLEMLLTQATNAKAKKLIKNLMKGNLRDAEEIIKAINVELRKEEQKLFSLM
tara:strand:- start:10 stop:336 length:327 start_codon:yes stop_codon:yes gene_type:complete